MAATFWTLYAAFIVAVTGLAYKCPAEYRRLAAILAVVIAGVLTIALIYTLGFVHGFSARLPDEPIIKDGVRYVVTPFSSNGLTGMGVAFATLVYIGLLCGLPLIRGLTKAGEKQD